MRKTYTHFSLMKLNVVKFEQAFANILDGSAYYQRVDYSILDVTRNDDEQICYRTPKKIVHPFSGLKM